MKISLMNIKRQHEAYSAEYEEAALRVLRSGDYIGGFEVTTFEEEFAAFHGAKYGISCGNGTDAIVLAMRALGIGTGDEVITVSWTFFATAESIAAVGALPVFVDVDPKTYCIDVNQIEKAITEKTKAILPVHFYGHSCDMDSLRELCNKYGLYLISDCAQATGTKYKGERKSILGDISCFSFFPTKNLGATGDGGMVLTDNEEFARACKSLKAHGGGKDGLLTLKNMYKKNNMVMPEGVPVGETKYYNYLIGYNSRLDAIQSAILREKLKHIDEFINGRRKNAFLYNEAFRDTNFSTPYEADYCEHSYYIYALKHKHAQRIIQELQKNGVPCGTYYPVPLHLQGAFLCLGYKKGDLPVTEELSETTFAIPVYPELREEERNYIINMIKKCDQ